MNSIYLPPLVLSSTQVPSLSCICLLLYFCIIFLILVRTQKYLSSGGVFFCYTCRVGVNVQSLLKVFLLLFLYHYSSYIEIYRYSQFVRLSIFISNLFLSNLLVYCFFLEQSLLTVLLLLLYYSSFSSQVCLSINFQF